MTGNPHQDTRIAYSVERITRRPFRGVLTSSDFNRIRITQIRHEMGHTKRLLRMLGSSLVDQLLRMPPYGNAKVAREAPHHLR